MKKPKFMASGKDTWHVAHRSKEWHAQHRLWLDMQRRSAARRLRKVERANGTPKE